MSEEEAKRLTLKNTSPIDFGGHGVDLIKAGGVLEVDATDEDTPADLYWRTLLKEGAVVINEKSSEQEATDKLKSLGFVLQDGKPVKIDVVAKEEPKTEAVKEEAKIPSAPAKAKEDPQKTGQANDPPQAKTGTETSSKNRFQEFSANADTSKPTGKEAE